MLVGVVILFGAEHDDGAMRMARINDTGLKTGHYNFKTISKNALVVSAQARVLHYVQDDMGFWMTKTG